jgi:hypothetical protein
VEVTSEHGAQVTPDLRERFLTGLQKVGADHATVVVTDDFDATVRRLTQRPEYAADRRSGMVVAKTLVDPPSTIVFNRRAIQKQSLTPHEIERFIVHEGCHVLMYNRNEDTSFHHDLASNQGEYNLISAAGEVIEEFRAELTTVRDLGYPPQRNCDVGDLARLLHNTNVDFVEAVLAPGISDPSVFERRMYQSVGLPLAKTLAVISAGAVAYGGDLTNVSPDRDDWIDYAQNTWPQRHALFESLPPATHPWDPDSYRAALRRGAEIEQQFLRDVGLEYVFPENGEWGLQGSVTSLHIEEREARARNPAAF